MGTLDARYLFAEFCCLGTSSLAYRWLLGIMYGCLVLVTFGSGFLPHAEKLTEKMQKIHHVGIDICLPVYWNVFCTYTHMIRQPTCGRLRPGIFDLNPFRGLPSWFAVVPSILYFVGVLCRNRARWSIFFASGNGKRAPFAHSFYLVYTFVIVYSCIFSALSWIRIELSLSFSATCSAWPCLGNFYTPHLFNLLYVSFGFLQHLFRPCLSATDWHQAAVAEVHAEAEMWFSERKRSKWLRDFQRKLLEKKLRFQMFQPVRLSLANPSAVRVLW